jgi:predicted DNA-binding transcriptional regulator AlpA
MTTPFPGQRVKDDSNDIFRSLPKSAQRPGLSESYLRKQIKAGNGPAYTKIGSRILVRDSDMDSWLATKRVA